MADPRFESARSDLGIQEGSKRRRNIMVVDDDSIVTDSIKTLLELETDYRILTYQSPKVALNSLNDLVVDLVISDFLMPDMNGIEFLAGVRKLYPELPCIMLTGYADKQNAIRAINEIGLFQYLEKPWDNENLKLIIRNGLMNKGLQELLHEKVKAYDQVLRERDQIMMHQQVLLEELKLAEKVQQSLLPTSFPIIDNLSIAVSYQPSLQIGGDFYDVIQMRDGKIALFLADIAGHGIQAALGTALLKFAVSRYAGSNESLASMLTGINEVVTRGFPNSMLTAALAAIYDARTGVIELANAGLPHPFVVRHGNCAIERVPANGLLLGIGLGDSYRPSEATRIQLSRGDCLLLYTDGLSEIENEDGEMFDEREFAVTLRELCGSTDGEFISQLSKAALRFSKREQPQDDTTVIAIKKI